MGLGVLIDKYRLEQVATRDAMFRHYIQLHPEDFPPYGNNLIMVKNFLSFISFSERVKVRDVFAPWRPVR